MGPGPTHVPKIHGLDAFHGDRSVAILFVVRCWPATRGKVRREGFLALGVGDEFELPDFSRGYF